MTEYNGEWVRKRAWRHSRPRYILPAWDLLRNISLKWWSNVVSSVVTISLALKKGFRFMAFHIVTTTIPRQNGGESVGSTLFVSDGTNGNREKHHQFAHNIFVLRTTKECLTFFPARKSQLVGFLSKTTLEFVFSPQFSRRGRQSSPRQREKLDYPARHVETGSWKERLVIR